MGYNPSPECKESVYHPSFSLFAPANTSYLLLMASSDTTDVTL